MQSVAANAATAAFVTSQIIKGELRTECSNPVAALPLHTRPRLLGWQKELERELAAARNQQAATAEILASISSSVADANQVFTKIAASAARLCDAHNSTVFQRADDYLRLVARHGPLPTM